MRRLSLSDTIFYNLGDCYMNAVAVFDGPVDLALLLAEMEGVIEVMPAVTEQSVRVGIWTFAKRSSGKIDLRKHVSVVRDASIRSVEQLVPRMDKLRRSPIRIDGPPWRMFVLNPAASDDANASDPPLSAMFIQVRHGLVDAIRGLQILSRMARYEPSDRHRAIAASLPSVDPLDLPGGIKVHDPGLSLLQVPRRGMVREGDSSERLAAVVATTVADEALFPHAQPLKGNIGRTRFVRRRTENGVGNHLKMVTVSTKGPGEKQKKKSRIPGLARAQDLPIMQWLVALAPRRLARRMMGIWYSNFDGIATLIPMPRNLSLGGRQVTATFGIPPLWGPVPLAMVALADGEHYNATLVPGNGFATDRASLLARVHRLLHPEKEGDTAEVEEKLAAFSEAPERPSSRRGDQGQGADGNSSSPVSLPARAKSP